MSGPEPKNRRPVGARVALALVVAPLAAVALAAPARATLLIRADGAGLFITDNNGDMNDDVRLHEPNADERQRWEINNDHLSDFIKFDARDNCEAPFASSTAFCSHFSPKARIELLSGNDEFHTGTTRSAELVVFGGPGSDTLSGSSGADKFNGGTGNDRVFGNENKDVLSGNDGSDMVGGGTGNDLVSGNDGSDVIGGDTGVDTLDGGSGDDTIRAKEPDGADSEADIVTCGTGVDFVVADLKDVLPSDGSCNEVDRSPVGETPHVRVARGALNVNAAGVARVRLSCPRKTTIGCKGSLSLRLARNGKRRPARAKYAIRAGKSQTVPVTLSAAETRRVNGKGKARGILTSLEKGKLGLKTTIRERGLR